MAEAAEVVSNMKKIVTDIINDKYLKKESLAKIKRHRETIIVSENNIISTWKGMGSALTESAAYNYSLLKRKDKAKFISDYYGKNGLLFDFGRVSIGSNDFSLSSYEYVTDNLDSFCIDRDKEYIIPMLEDIYKVKKISLIASPWTPPRYMKTNYSLILGGKLKKKYYDDYANYLIKFIDTYKTYGFNIDYLTIQNEPRAIQVWESCLFNYRNMKKFINDYLIDKLDNTKILLWDHNREKLDKVVKKLYIESPFIGGLGVHWYTGGYYDKIAKVHEKYPDLFIVNTEMCCGFSQYDEYKWISDAELYLNDILSCMKSGMSAYLDFNILLDYEGGPNHKGNFVKAPSILNKDKSSYIKSPIYYYLYHVSHFIKKGYEIINTISSNTLNIISAKNGKEIVMVILNKTDKNISYEVNTYNKEFIDKIDAHSIITYVI